MMQGDKVAAHVFAPYYLYRFSQPFGILERVPASHNFEDQSPHLVAVWVASPHLAQFLVGWRLEVREDRAGRGAVLPVLYRCTV